MSALSGKGLAALGEAIIERLVPEAPAAGAPLPFTEAQRRELERASEFVQRGDFNAADELLRRSPCFALSPTPR